MALSHKIPLRNCTILIYGSHHTISDVENIQDYIESFSPDLICMEADPKMKAIEHTVDVSGIEELSRKNSIEFWHIDTYSSDFNLDDRISDLTEDEKERVTGIAKSIEASDNMRDALSELDKKSSLYNSRRESAMIGSILYAKQKYGNILLIVGAAHYSRIYRIISALF